MHLAATDRGEFITLVAGKRPSLLMAGNNDEVYDEKPQRYAEDNVTQWSLSNNNKRLHTSYYSVEANYTDRLKASRGLSATAELIAPNVSDTLAKASESVTELA